MARRGGKEKEGGVALAYLSSPGTAFPIPEAAYAASVKQHEKDKNTWWHSPLSLVTGGFKPNCRPPTNRGEGKSPCYVHNGHLILQGPNYGLAKTLQNWRTVLARAEGAVVSANMVGLPFKLQTQVMRGRAILFAHTS